MDVKEDIASEALRIVTGSRRSAYGTPERNFERIARLWNAHLANRFHDLPENVRLAPGDVAALMRLMKEARLAETPDHRDSFVDLVGYSLCGAEVAGIPGSDDARPLWAEALADELERRVAEPESDAKEDAAAHPGYLRAHIRAMIGDAVYVAGSDLVPDGWYPVEDVSRYGSATHRVCVIQPDSRLAVWIKNDDVQFCVERGKLKPTLSPEMFRPATPEGAPV